MKIAIATDDNQVSPHFGRCSAYTVIEVKEGKIIHRETIPNPGHRPGFLPNYLAQRGVNCIIAGGMGPRAQSLFAQFNIETITGIQGPVEEVIDKLLRQELEEGEDLCDHHHYEHDHSEQKLKELTISPGDKIAITAQGDHLEAEVDPSFGRCAYFIIIEPQTMNFRAYPNPNRELAQGAGIKSAQFLAQQGVRAVLTGECGPKASQVLAASGIQIITGASGPVRQALNSIYPGEDK
jgi:predicted Fe-Mo cluster-binding NifX family protein